MKDTRTVFEDWDELCQFIETHTNSGTWFFRGESQVFPRMLSKIDRITTETNRPFTIHELLYHELQTMSTFFVRAAGSSGGIESTFFSDWLPLQALMRHYGGPTRLLDWTLDWRVALFWACIDDPDQPGRIFAFNKKSHYGIIKHNYLMDSNKIHGRVRYLNGMPIAYIHDVQYVNLCNEYVDIYDSSTKFPRLVVQQGLFTYATRPQADHWLILKRMLAKHQDKYMSFMISPKLKSIIINKLDLWHINYAFLLPGPEGAAKLATTELQNRLLPS